MWKSLLRLLAIVVGFFLVGTPFFQSGRHRLYAHDVQEDLIAIDAGKEQYSVTTNTPFGKSLPGGIEFMVEEQYLNDPPQARATGEFVVGALAQDPSFAPFRPVHPDSPALDLPVEFSERPSTLPTTADSGSDEADAE
jgi:hypothetical protein